MNEEIKLLTPITEADKKVIKNKTAYGLPDRPSYTGMKAAEIKKAFWSPVIDDDEKLSLLYLIERTITEVNTALTVIGEALANDFVEQNELETAVSGIKGAVSTSYDSLEKIAKKLSELSLSKLSIIGNETSVDKAYVMKQNKGGPQLVRVAIRAGGINGHAGSSIAQRDTYGYLYSAYTPWEKAWNDPLAKYRLMNWLAVEELIKELKDNILGGAEGAYDTLLEIKQALDAGDETLEAAILNAVANHKAEVDSIVEDIKKRFEDVENAAGFEDGIMSVARGGTGADSIYGALKNLASVENGKPSSMTLIFDDLDSTEILSEGAHTTLELLKSPSTYLSLMFWNVPYIEGTTEPKAWLSDLPTGEDGYGLIHILKNGNLQDGVSDNAKAFYYARSGAVYVFNYHQEWLDTDERHGWHKVYTDFDGAFLKTPVGSAEYSTNDIGELKEVPRGCYLAFLNNSGNMVASAGLIWLRGNSVLWGCFALGNYYFRIRSTGNASTADCDNITLIAYGTYEDALSATNNIELPDGYVLELHKI